MGTKGRQLRLEPLERRLCLAVSAGWDGPGLGDAALSYYVAPVPSGMGLTQAAVESGFETALDAWASVADITFTRTALPGRPNSIDLTFRDIDGAGGTLAQAYYPDDVNREPIAGDVEFDISERWEIGNDRGFSATDLVLVAVHEIGHSLGLEHSDNIHSVMYPNIGSTEMFEELDQSDVDAILALYASAPIAPSLASVQLDQTVISENDTLTLSGSYLDLKNSYWVVVDWGDGSPETVADVDPSTGEFLVAHQYLDDGVSGTEADDYTIAIRVEDTNSQILDTTSRMVTVENTRPRLDGLAVTPIDEGAVATLTGTIEDPGSLDSFTVMVNWGDGSETAMFSYPAGSRSINETHLYADDPGDTFDDQYEIMVTVLDDDAESYIGLTTVAVANVAPEIAIVGVPPIGWSGHTIELQAEIADPGMEDVHTVVWYVTRNGNIYTQGAGTDFSFEPMESGIYEVTVRVDDGDGGTDTSTATIAVDSGLGTIDFLTLDELSLAGQPVSLVFSTAHTGILTLETLDVDAAESVTLFLYDQNPLNNDELVPLAQASSADGSYRIDHGVSEQQTCYVQLEGTSDDFRLRITNLVNHDGTSVSVFGTEGDDTFRFSAAAGRDIAINGVSYHFDDSEAADVAFAGGTGFDQVILEDSTGNESLEAWATSAVLSNGSEDEVADFTVEVSAFEEMHVYARGGGTDTAILHDSENDDKFKAEPDENYAKMYGGAMYNRVKFFDVVQAVSSGGQDLARFFDTSGDDVYEGQKDTSRLSGDDFDVQAYGFERVYAFASEGTDRATFVDSPLKDEFHAKPWKSELFDQATDGEVYRITARRFDSVLAEATNTGGDDEDGGQDIAKIWPTSFDDLIEASDNWLRFSVQGDTLEVLYETVAFETVRVRATDSETDRIEVVEPLAFDLIIDGGWE